MLRRRHRVMIEEAIRNGTLPPPFGYQRPRVDLSKKPKMWNAWIETAPEPPKTGGRSREKEWYWDMIKPFSAISTLPPPLPPNGAAGNGDDRNRRPSMMDTLRHASLFAARMPTNDSTTPSTTQLASASAALANLDSGNVSLKVAVLIAMPRKPPSSSDKSPSTARSHQSPLPRSVSTSPSSRPLSAATITEQCHDPVDDEESLPHLEIGVTEVRVVPNADLADTDMQEKTDV
ncbi:hypothetical protein M378DRAFT_593445 [Amanita muscaria Koide BX008]|uniref:Uncharacterized protein n=1 Tax=Amanita muscaria (strain Koide BX008) TaxID=946122 RepID=A0A0C2SM75_AMAMK|nr:hypothetical protein M378DRAFT_593445 [Amanita muscaria Koide BX008]